MLAGLMTHSSTFPGAALMLPEPVETTVEVPVF